MPNLSHDLWIAIFIIATLTFIVLALLYPALSGDARANKRRARFIKSDHDHTEHHRNIDPGQRRQQIIDGLQEAEIRQKKDRRLTLERRILQAGLQLSKAQFCTWCVISGLGLAALWFLFSDDPVGLVLGYLIGGFGAPFFLLAWLRDRRVALFLEHFAAAIDIIVRGVRAGLPLTECLSLVARESTEPVATEFRLLHDAQSIGFTLAEAVERLADRIPCAEARFFAILITIQQGSGGNLSEGLGNLSSMLRDRKRMQQKVQAMSTEAKVSASIIGALPFAISAIVYFTSPGYMDMFIDTSQGQMILMGCLVWMGIGVFIMKRMISFDI